MDARSQSFVRAEAEAQGSYTQGEGLVGNCQKSYANSIALDSAYSSQAAVRLMFGQWIYTGDFTSAKVALRKSAAGGIADIYVDDELTVRVDTFAPDASAQKKEILVSAASGLAANRRHTLKVEFSANSQFSNKFRCGLTEVIIDYAETDATLDTNITQDETKTNETTDFNSNGDCLINGECNITIGEEGFASEVSFETLPVEDASSINDDSAVLEGEIKSIGSLDEILYWFKYYPCSDASLAQETEKKTATGPEQIKVNVSDLFPDTQYCYSLIVQDPKNSQNILTGDPFQFQTDPPQNGLQCPNLSEPLNKATIDTLQPRLAWKTSEGVVRYRYILYQGMWNGERKETGDTAENGKDIANGSLAWGNEYYWGINACKDDSMTDCTGWCLPYSFSAGKKLSRPNIISPTEGSRYDTPPEFKWESVLGASNYQYSIFNESGAEIEKNTTAATKFYSAKNFDLGNYVFKVRACADISLKNCGDYSSAAFKIVEPENVFGECSLLTIGTQKTNNGKIYIDKCFPAKCPEHYDYLAGNVAVDIFKEFSVSAESGNYPNIYLLDEKAGVKYYPGEINHPILQYRKLKLVVASIGNGNNTDYSNGLLGSSGGGPGIVVTPFNDARAQYAANKKIPTGKMFEARQDGYGRPIDVEYLLGIAAENPIFTSAGQSISANEYFKVVQLGDYYVIPQLETAMPGEAQLDISLPKFFTFQTIDNVYFNTGCLPEVSQSLSFEIKPSVKPECDPKKVCAGGICKIEDARCDIVADCPEDISITNDPTVPKTITVQSDAEQIDASITCVIIPCDSNGNCDVSEMVFNSDDLDRTQPKINDFFISKTNYCAMPMQIFLAWETNLKIQGKFQIQIARDRQFNEIVAVIEEAGQARIKEMQIPNYGGAYDIPLPPDGEQRYFARVKVWNEAGNKDSGDTSPVLEFYVPSKPLDPAYFTWQLKATTTNGYEFAGSYTDLGEGFEAPAIWKWYFDKQIKEIEKMGKKVNHNLQSVQQQIELITRGTNPHIECATSAELTPEPYIIWKENPPDFEY